ncbi:MAG: prephenate dehydrogenase/arogenate dehydrogenase family protein [Intestinimonas sp.]|jgi:prephenate dehydrogenase|nr:prephenate dehydrogenase/arogenate dehydrogenase family protein [Intestinimonas sp.]
MMNPSIALIGLGLIGGSMAIALQGFENYEIVGVDRDPTTLSFARKHHVADRVTDDAETAVAQADLVFLCLHPRGIVDFMSAHRDGFRPGCLVTDVCGIKTAIVRGSSVLPDSVDFIGGHPMAGKETSGITHADGTLFHEAHYILTPRPTSTPEHLALMARIAAHIGCRDVVKTTVEQHDNIIAYTSQAMHIMAVAVCDDPDLFTCRGFEGGSFRDCTRVAALDVPLWTELFSMNRGALSTVIRHLEENLHAYRMVLESGDPAALAEKLAYSAARKRRMNLE